MKRIGFWIGVSMLGFVVLAHVVNIFVQHGWAGVAGVAFIVTAVMLTIRCS